MNKRGQIYILAAIIVCMVAFLLVSKPNLIREQVLLQNFKGISSNYLTESPKVINEVLESGTPSEDLTSTCTSDPLLCEIRSKLSGFTRDFVDSYAKNQDPNIGLIYIYNDENGMIIQNYLNNENVAFLGQSGGNVLLNYNQEVSGDIVFVGSGTNVGATTPLCESGNEDYCILETGKVPLGTYTLKIGDISYEFDITSF